MRLTDRHIEDLALRLIPSHSDALVSLFDQRERAWGRAGLSQRVRGWRAPKGSDSRGPRRLTGMTAR